MILEQYQEWGVLRQTQTMREKCRLRLSEGELLLGNSQKINPITPTINKSLVKNHNSPRYHIQ